MNKKYLQLVLWGVSIAAAAAIATWLWAGAFPVAAVQFPLTRDDVSQRLSAFVGALGAPVAEYRAATDFGESTTEKNYLERQYGAQRLAEAAGKGVDIWHWGERWFKPEQVEEYDAWSDQAGNVVGYWHRIEDERALPDLSEGAARLMAEGFLKKFVTQHPWAALKFVESSSDKKPHRTDFTFTWEQDGLRYGDAPYQLYVTVQGNEIGSYNEGLKVPQGWVREYERQRSVNELCLRIASFFAILAGVGTLIAFIRAIRNHQVRWRQAIPWGWLAVFGLVAAGSQLNNIPELVFDYSTTQTWSTFLAGSFFSGLRSVLWQVIGFWLLLVVADCLYRERLPGKSSFRRALGRDWLRDPQTVRALGVGIAFAFFSFAYVCVFYTVGQKCGVWCPVDIDYSKTLSGWMPWVDAMQTGLTAGFSEEMLFRVAALLIFWWVLRVRWLAVVLAAATWGFLHSNYPQMPGYVRGIELTIVGIVWGTLLLRYGVVATLTAHYLYDCWLGSLIAFQSSSWENKVGAVAVSVWPVALFLWACYRKAPALDAEAAFEPATPPPPPPPPLRDWTFVPLPLGRAGAAAILAGCLAILGAIAWIPRPQDPMHKLGRLDLSRSQIEERADAFLAQQGYSPAGYRRIANLSAYPISESFQAPDYLLEHGNLAGLAGLYQTVFPDLFWSVRYFRFLQEEEFSVYLDQHGRFISWSHRVLREAPGAQLSEPEALARAQPMLARGWNLDFAKQQLVEVEPTRQEHREDWRFVFEQRDFGWGEAKLRSLVRLQGAEAMGALRLVRIPEAWLIEHQKAGWRRFFSEELAKWTSLAEYALIGVLLILVIRKHLVPWRRAFLYALFPLAIKAADQLNHAPWFYAEYATTTPLANYLIVQIGTGALALVLTYLAAVFSIGVALGFLHWAWGWTPDQLTLWPRERRGLFWRDTLLITFAGMILMSILAFLQSEALGWLAPAKVANFAWWRIEEWAPCVGAATQALQEGYSQLLHVAIYASVLRLIWLRHPGVAWAAVFFFPLLAVAGESTAAGFFTALAYGEAMQLLLVWLVLRLWKFNGAAIFLTYFLASLWGSIALFLEKGGPVYRWQAAPLLGGLLLAVAGGVWLHRRGGPDADQLLVPKSVIPPGI